MPWNIFPVSPPTDEEKGTGSEYAHLDSSQLFSGASNTSDRSGPLFSFYSDVVSEEDNKLAERWQKDADGMLIFTGLFSAVVAAFLAVSFQDLQPDPQDTSNFYLQNIYLALTESNTSSIPPGNVVQPPAFSPSCRAIWVNLLWVLSLGIGLTCAIMATILQQWARQYLKLTQVRQLGPKRKARIHALFSGSTDKLLIKCLGYLLPCYLHLSVLFFFIGLLLFLFGISNKIFNATLWLYGSCIVIYAFFTILPFVKRDSLLFTPFSAFPVAIFAFIICIITTAFGFRFHAKLSNFFERLFTPMEGTGKRLTLGKLPELDTHIFEATLDSLGGDDAVEKFFGAIPAFFSSNSSEPLPITPRLVENFGRVMKDFLDHTFQLTTVTESIKASRFFTCLNASRAMLGPRITSGILSDVLNGKLWPEILQSVEIGHLLRSWSNGSDEEYARYARCIVSRIVANGAEKHDDRWSALVKDELGISEDLLRDYLASPDNILLANFNNITRQIFRSHWYPTDWNVFELLLQCDISRVLPSLQHDFCALWNDIVQEARKVRSSDSISISILKDIRHVYIKLHMGTTASPTAFSASTLDHDTILGRASSYPSCNIAAHRSHPLPENHDQSAENVCPALATHSSAQAVLLRTGVSGAGTRPLDLPAHHTAFSPANESSAGIVTGAPQYATLATSSSGPSFSASLPLSTPPSDVTAIDARTNVSSISSVTNSSSHLISGGVASSHQNDNRSLAVPPSPVKGVVPRSPHTLGSLSLSTTMGHSHNVRDANIL